MGSLWCSVAVCVALVWIFLLDFNCEQLEVSHKYWIYACSPMPDLQATSGVCTTSISLKYISPCNVASISARPITAVNVIYTVLFFLVADWILWSVARRQMEQVDL